MECLLDVTVSATHILSFTPTPALGVDAVRVPVFQVQQLWINLMEATVRMQHRWDLCPVLSHVTVNMRGWHTMTLSSNPTSCLSL